MAKMWSDKDLDDFLYKKDRCRKRLNSITPKKGPSDRQYEDISSCSAFHQSTTESARLTLRGRNEILQTFGGRCRRSRPTTSPALTPTRQEVSRNATSSCRRRGEISATLIATTPKSSATTRTTAPTLRQSVSKISDTDNGSTSSSVDISRISRS